MRLLALSILLLTNTTYMLAAEAEQADLTINADALTEALAAQKSKSPKAFLESACGALEEQVSFLQNRILEGDATSWDRTHLARSQRNIQVKKQALLLIGHDPSALQAQLAALRRSRL